MAVTIGNASPGTHAMDCAAKTCCHKAVTVTLAGSTGDWSKALIATSASIATYSDGYTVLFSTTLNGWTAANGAMNAACFVRAGTVVADDNTGVVVVVKSGGASANTKIAANGHTVKFLTTAQTKTTCGATASTTDVSTLGTALTVATNQLKTTPA